MISVSVQVEDQITAGKKYAHGCLSRVEFVHLF